MQVLEIDRGLESKLDVEEERVLSFLHKERPELVDLFLNHLPQARRGILHRLVQAMVRENIGGVGKRTVWRPEAHLLEVQVTPDLSLRLPVGMRYSMGQFDLLGEVVLTKSHQDEVIQHPIQLLERLRETELVKEECCQQQFALFYREIQNSVANYALALVGAELRGRRLQQAAGEGIKNCLQWVERQMAEDRWFSPLAFFEQWVVEGHPLHPGTKIKMGLDVVDVIHYSPEWGAEPELVLVAVHKNACQVNALDGITATEILCKEYPGLREQVEATLGRWGLQVQEYEIIPVHPWQFEHMILPLFAAEMEQKIVIPIPDYRIRTAALVSVRTLAPLQPRGEGKHHIKTAIAVQTTSAFRTISPQSAHNAPMVTHILQKVQKQEQFFGGHFLVMGERVGLFYHSPHHGKRDAKEVEESIWRSKNLAAILRENVESHVREGEMGMPAAALIATCPFRKELIVCELVKAFALHHQLRDRQEAVLRFVRQYADIALPGFLTLMSRYGISLEGHLQNSVPVFAKGAPVRMILRDFGGVRIWRERLLKQGFTTSFYPGSVTITEDGQDVQNKLFYAVFQNHLGELIRCLVREYGMEERELWKPIAEVARKVFASLKQDPLISAQAKEDEEALFAEELGLKALTTMRLLGDVSKYTFASVSNPLAQVSSEVDG
jgi:siderophore synthetase component